MGFEKIVCCYHRFTAFVIQYALLIFSIIGPIFNIIGLVILKWEFIHFIIKIIYILCLIIFILSIFSISIIIYFRHKNTINDKYNKPSIKLSIGNIILSIFGITFSFLCLIVVWIKYDKKKNYYINGEKVISGKNRFFMFLCLGINSRFMGFLFFLWISILIRLIKKTNGPYIVTKVENIPNNSTMTVEKNVNISNSYIEKK